MSAQDTRGRATMSEDDRVRRFRELHRPGQPLLMPNPWDLGSARLLASLGFEALATTSSGFAATIGRLDGSVTRDEALAHAAAIVSATNLPVSADLENGFADSPEGVAETAVGAVEAGLAGFSIEDASGDPGDPIYPTDVAARRVRAAAEVAHGDGHEVVLTARAENFLHGRPDLEDTIARLRAYERAGADVLYAPGLTSAEEIGAVIGAVSLPVNVLTRPGVPAVSELAALGVSRVSVGGAFAFVATAAVVTAARELRDKGTYGYASAAAEGVRSVRKAFG